MTTLSRSSILIIQFILANVLAGQLPAGLDSIRSIGVDSQKVQAYSALALANMDTDLDAAIVVLEEGIDVAKAAGELSSAAKFHYLLGIAYFNTNRLADSKVSQEQGLELYLELGDSGRINQQLYEIASVDLEMGNYEDASLAARRLYRMCKRQEDYLRLSRTCIILYRITELQGDQNRALAYAEEAVEAARKATIPNALPESLALAGEAYRQDRQLAKSIAFADEAVEKGKQMNPYMEHYTLTVRVNILKDLQRFDDALADLQRVREIEGEYASSVTFLSLGELYQMTGDWDAARKNVYRSMQLMDREDVGLDRKMVAYEMLMAHELNADQLDTLRRYLELYKIGVDSLQSAANYQTTLELEEKYGTADRNARIARQEKDIATRNTQLYATLGFLLLAIGAGILFFNLSRKLRRQNNANEKLVAEKETLIGEIHHRVKNNLQVISSLLQLQSRQLSDENALDALRESQSRVQAMGLIHQKLYQGEEVTSVPVAEYFKDLGETLLDAYRLDDRVELYLDVEPMDLDVDRAIPLGLIVNELITNSLKYAYPGDRQGTIELSLWKEGNELRMKVADDGVGKAHAPVLKDSTSFGSNLVELLTKKLKGNTSELQPERGFATEIRIPLS